MNKARDDLLEYGCGIISNAYNGDWGSAPSEWREAAENWVNIYEEILKQDEIKKNSCIPEVATPMIQR